jgi:hypothetical protein
MGGFLLLPEDEPALVAHLLEAESLTRLAHDDLSYGPPVVGALEAPLPLPEPPRPGVEPGVPRRFTFWVPDLGELSPARHRFIDYERSPVLTWRRTSWHASGALCPGLLGTQTRPRKDQPVELLRLLARVEKWMKRSGVRLDPFDHAPDEPPVERPANVKPFAVWAHPHAAQWVRGGGSVWPWNA